MMKKILIYYSGLQKPSVPSGGTGRAIINRAMQLFHYHNDLSITLCGSNVGEFLQLDDNLAFVQTPTEVDREEFLKLFDIVVFCSTMSDFGKMAKPAGQRWILDLHFWCPESVELTRVQDFDLICVRSELQKVFVKSKIRNCVPVEYVYNSVDGEMFSPDPTIKRIPNSLMFAGAIVPHKGVEKVIQASVVLSQYIPDLTLNIYGSAWMWRHADAFEATLRKLSPPYVKFHGATPYEEMPKVFAQNSVLVLPSDLESFGLVTAEAQACGCIPVVHNCGGTPVTVEDGWTGMLYAPNQLDFLVRAIQQALTFSESQRNAARSFVKNKFNPQKLTNQFYHYIVNGYLPPSSQTLHVEKTITPAQTQSPPLLDKKDTEVESQHKKY